MAQGRILYLNGLTSTGKSSVARELLSCPDKLCFLLGFDLFEETLPPWAADVDEYYANAIIAMYHAARSFSLQGRDVLIDGLVMNIPGLERHYETLLAVLDGCPLYMIHMHCSLETCRKRNLARGDRRENQSLVQNERAEKRIRYHMELDTDLYTIAECAEQIASRFWA